MILPCALMYVCTYVCTHRCLLCLNKFMWIMSYTFWYLENPCSMVCTYIQYIHLYVCAHVHLYMYMCACVCVFVPLDTYVDLLYVLHKPDFSVLFEGTVAVGHCVIHTYVATSVWLHFAEYYTNLCTVLIFANCALLPLPSILPCIIAASLRSYTPFTFISIPTYTVCVCIRCIILAVPIL